MMDQYLLVIETGDILTSNLNIDMFWNFDKNKFMNRSQFQNDSLLELTVEDFLMLKDKSAQDRIKCKKVQTMKKMKTLMKITRYYLVEDTGEILTTSTSNDKYISSDTSELVDKQQFDSKTLLNMTEEEFKFYEGINQEDRVKYKKENYFEWVRQLKQNDLVIYDGPRGEQIGVIEEKKIDNLGRQTFKLNLKNRRKGYDISEQQLRQMKDSFVKYYRCNDKINNYVMNIIVIEWNNAKYIYPKMYVVSYPNVTDNNFEIITQDQFQRYTLRVYDKCTYKSKETMVIERSISELGILYKLKNQNTCKIYDNVLPFDIDIQQLQVGQIETDNLMASQISDVSAPSRSQLKPNMKTLVQSARDQSKVEDQSEGQNDNNITLSGKLRYETKDIPPNERKFEIEIDHLVRYYHRDNAELLTKFGTVKWIGYDWVDKTYLYGIELEDNMYGATDGCFHSQQLFFCPSGRGILAKYIHVAPDIRFAYFEITEPTPISQDPVAVYPSIDIENYLGTEHGIQGNANSTYIDATIFALFLKNEKLDYIFTEIHHTCDITSRFQKVLAHNIVYPLRKHGFVSYHHTKAMRDIIREYGPTFNEMADKETDTSNMSALMNKLLPKKPLLKIISYIGKRNQSIFLQLSITLDHKPYFLSTETMLELSMIQNKMLLEKDPAFMIFQAPRDIQTNDNYKYVLPVEEIEVSRICGQHIRKCAQCSKVAVFSCIKCCFDSKNEINTLMAYRCLEHKCNHDVSNEINYGNQAFTNISNGDYCHRPVKLHLRSIICIEKGHFVSFVKDCNYESEKWMYFDSIATQKLNSSIPVPEVKWDSEIDRFMSLSTNEMKGEIINLDTSKLKKIICNAYVFVYENIVMSV